MRTIVLMMGIAAAMAAQAADKVKIGFISTLSGPNAAIGSDIRDGFNLAITPSGQRVYATTAAGTLYVLDAASYAVLDTLNVGPAANGLTFSPDECTLYVTSRDAGTVTAVSTVSNTITRTYYLGGSPQRIAAAPDGSELYVANERSGLDVVDVESGAVTSVSLGTAAYGLGLTPDAEQRGKTALVTTEQAVVFIR